MNVSHCVRSGGILGIYFRFFNMKVYCVFSLESPHRGDSNEYIQYTIFNTKKENHPKLSQICSYYYGILLQGTQEGVRNSHGKQAISVRAIEVLSQECHFRICEDLAQTPRKNRIITVTEIWLYVLSVLANMCWTSGLFMSRKIWQNCGSYKICSWLSGDIKIQRDFMVMCLKTGTDMPEQTV